MTIKNQEFISQSTNQTQEIAANITGQVKDHAVICLYGNLGSGKTTFVQGFAKALGVTDNIPSPTFVLLRLYKFGKNSVLYHFDLYRLDSQKDVANIGLTEILEDQNGIVLIEWAEKAQKLLPKKRFDIYFDYINESTRKIRVRSAYGK